MQIINIEFQSDRLTAVERQGEYFVAVRPICEAIGVDWSSQRKRINRDPILRQGVVMMTTAPGGYGPRELCLRFDLVNGWLFTIDAGRVRAASRPKVLAYKAECHRVLFRHFYGAAAERIAKGVSFQLETKLDPVAVAARAVNLRAVAEARRIFGPVAAAELWRELGLPSTVEIAKGPRQGLLPLPAPGGGSTASH